jgi:phenylpyruvate tautomerase PptA (4-oxalocrotonate tautomerase family)
MPYVNIVTNAGVTGEAGRMLIAAASQAVAGTLGKDERYVMVTLESGTPMLFGGDDGPAAFLDVRSIGLPEDQAAPLSRALCEVIRTHLSIPPERVYLTFAAVPRALWGWNGGTF